MTRYMCTACNYRFEPKSEKKGILRTCPYCGKTGTVTEEKKAQEILNEVSDVDEEF